MSENIDLKKQWHSILTLMLEEYHKNKPEDLRNDRDIITDIMDNFVESGLIKKKNGKYILPELTNNS